MLYSVGFDRVLSEKPQISDGGNFSDQPKSEKHRELIGTEKNFAL